jgi:hypothetical protein
MNTKAGLYCTLNGNDPAMVVTLATQGAEQPEFVAYQSSDACMLVGREGMPCCGFVST